MENKGPVIPVVPEVNNPDYLIGTVHVYEDYWQK